MLMFSLPAHSKYHENIIYIIECVPKIKENKSKEKYFSCEIKKYKQDIKKKEKKKEMKYIKTYI